MKKSSLHLLIALFLSACTSNTDDIQNEVVYTETHTIVMNFYGNVQSFDQTRAATTISDGSIMYITLSNGSGSEIHGTAVYNTSIQNWEMTYTGNLNNINDGSCTLYYFDNATSTSSTKVLLDSNSVCYKGLGTYSKTTTSLNVTAILKPDCARLRFKGTNGKVIKISGINYMNSFDINSSSFTQSNAADGIDFTIPPSGYTPYIYYRDCSNKISITVDNATYAMDSNTNMKIHGKSGYLTIPTTTNHNGWAIECDYSNASRPTFTVNGVSFNMILVEHGTFVMGATADQDSDAYENEKPAHQVTLTNDYYIGETEVTQALWKAVTGYSPTSNDYQWSSEHGFGSDYPAYYINYSDVVSFISRLNNLTGKTFGMPTEAQWEFAARGGNKSKGFKYSGSNNIDDVAWYDGNSNSTAHQVKTKLPNELGIYDMSGNVSEWCADYFHNYNSDSQSNPTGPTSGSSRIVRDCSWFSPAKSCRLSSRTSADPYFNRLSTLGFRLVLSY